MKRDNFLPGVTEYTKYLNIASIRFSMPLDECRDKFGLYTNEQWFNLFNPTAPHQTER